MKQLFTLLYLIAFTLSAGDDHSHELSKNSSFGLLSSQTTPRVALVGQTTTVRFEFIMNPGSTTGAPVLVLVNGTRLSTNDAGTNGDVTAGDGIFSVNVPMASLGAIKAADTAYRVDVGSLEVTESAGVSKYNIFMNVMDETIPNVPVRMVNASAQQSAHLLNIAAPTQLANLRQFKATNGGNVTQDLTTLVFGILPRDQYDVLFASYDRNHFDNSFYQVINNRIGGIGKSPINLAEFNAGTRLMGLMMIGSPIRFDGADTQFTHELGHHWMASLTLNNALTDGRPHWPPSTMGSGVMGVSIAGSGAGGTFFCEGSFNAAGTAVTLKAVTQSTSNFNLFNPLDLYLMGLMPAAQVPDQIIYDSADMKGCKPGTYTTGYTRLKVQDVINAHGPRTPAFGQAPTSFKVASVIVSSQLLTAREMAYFDLMARRASWRFETVTKTGFVTEKAAPFYRATGGRGTMDSVMDASLLSHEVRTVTEFYNAALKRYFYTADPLEAAFLKATPSTGEVATGDSFKVYGLVNAPPEALPVCRFYGSVNPGPNSHFYTALEDECASLKAQQSSTPATQKRWNYEGLAYRVKLPVAGACASNQSPVYRLYNNGFSSGKDSNHRFTTSLATAQSMVAQGYANEGIVMCSDN